MNKASKFIMFLLLMSSCSNKSNLILTEFNIDGELYREYYEKGNTVIVKEYFNENKIMNYGYEIFEYPEKLIIDTVKVFNQRNKLVELRYNQGNNDSIWIKKKLSENTICKGKVNDFNIPIGEWNTYSSLSERRSTVYYINLDRSTYMNQFIVYGTNGNIDKKKSIYYDYSVDTITSTEYNNYKIKFYTPTEKKNDRTRGIMLGDFDEYYSNYVELYMDNKVTSGKIKKNKTITINVPKDAVQLVRGIYNEYYPNDSHLVEYKMYFEMGL